MKDKEKKLEVFFSSLLMLFVWFLNLQHAQAGISPRARSHFSKEIQTWQSKGYELDKVIITNLNGGEYIIATLSPSPRLEKLRETYAEIRGILKIYTVKEDKVISFFEKGFDAGLYDFEVRDIDDDRSNEIIVTWSFGGNAWDGTGIAIFEMREGYIVPVEVKPSITSPSKIPNLIPAARLVDLDGNRVYELLVLDTTLEFAYSLCHACSPAAWKVFSWKNGYYQEDSSSFPFYYRGKIRKIKEKLVSKQADPGYFLGDAISLYLNYYYMGEAKEGFKELVKLILDDEFIDSWRARQKSMGWESLSEIVDDLLLKYPF